MFNNDKELAQYEHIQYLQNLIFEKDRRSTLNSLMLLAVFLSLGYLGTQSIPLSIVIGLLPVLIRGAADDVILTNLRTEHNRSICEFDGDIESLNLRLKTEKNMNDTVRRWWQ
jgi:hypothetical protein